MRRTWSIESFEAIGAVAFLVFVSGLGEFIPAEAWLLLVGVVLMYGTFHGLTALVGQFRQLVWLAIVVVLPGFLLWLISEIAFNNP